METFKIGDRVSVKDYFIDGEIVDIKENLAYVEFRTAGGGGCLPFEISELEHENDEMSEHPVWKVLDKEKYVEEFIPKIEKMYDFIKSIVNICGNTTIDGNTVPTMQVFFNMWNEYSSETFWILDSLVNSDNRWNVPFFGLEFLYNMHRL